MALIRLWRFAGLWHSFAVDSISIDGGSMLIDGSLAVTNGLQVNTGGTLGGGATISGDLTVNGGTVSPGKSTGQLAVGAGNYSATSKLIVELGGLVPGTGFDQVNHTGNVQLGGTLDVQLATGFTPAYGNTFNVVTYTGVRSGV